ncbi:gliding motility lipoprotein GldH [Wenyingzhuangia sp. IMCC45533]
MALQNLNKYFYIFICVISISCDRYKKYDEYKTLENGVWDKDSIVSFEVVIEDVSKPYHVFLNLRTDNDFPYRNMFVISKVTLPSGAYIKDTLEYEMADAFGNWLGEGLTDVRNNKLFLLENHQFKTRGKYVFEFEQSMRKRGSVMGLQALRGVIDVGLRIEEIKK